MSAVFFILIALCALLFMGGVWEAVTAPKDPVNDRLSKMQQETPLQRSRRDGMKRDQESEAARDMESRASKNRIRRKDLAPALSRFLTKAYIIEKLDADLAAARSPVKATEVFIACWVCVCFFGLIGRVIFQSWIGFFIPAPTFFLPWYLVKFYSGRFIRKFEMQLADTLMTMANALRAGYSYMQTVELVARESLPPIGEEFKTMCQEIQVGITPEQALLNFANRVKSADVELMVTAVIIQRRVGGSLAEILDTIAHVIRDRVRLRMQIQTLTAQGKITGTMLSLMPAFIGLAVHLITKLTGGTPYMEPLLTMKTGHILIVIALCMQFTGFMIIRKIVAIEL